MIGKMTAARKTASSANRRRVPLGIFRAVNARLEPRVRDGFASPGLFPAGLVVLETTGRRSGRVYRTPLLATMGPSGLLWVSTVLGARADWLRNAHHEPKVRYWLHGKAHAGQAIVAAPSYPRPDLSSLSPFLRWAATKAVGMATSLGFGLLIIVPEPKEEREA